MEKLCYRPMVALFFASVGTASSLAHVLLNSCNGLDVNCCIKQWIEAGKIVGSVQRPALNSKFSLLPSK